MNKIAILNVGGASSAYIEIDDVKLIIDLGAGNDFSPVNDFLIPLANKKDLIINQLFLTHLDNDHISDYMNFKEAFGKAELMTVPNDHHLIDQLKKINRNKIGDNSISKVILDDMKKRSPGRYYNAPDYNEPLAVYDESFMKLFYIPPSECEQIDNAGLTEYPNYANNISLLIHISVNNHSILFTGDIMSNGMEHLINSNNLFKGILEASNLDFLVTPHHGLDTAFPAKLFETVKDGKVKLNIISEKKLIKEDSENRHNVDRRYYSENFSTGYTVLGGLNMVQYGTITSRGHIVIDFEGPVPIIKRCSSNEDLISEFV